MAIVTLDRYGQSGETPGVPSYSSRFSTAGAPADASSFGSPAPSSQSMVRFGGPKPESKNVQKTEYRRLWSKRRDSRAVFLLILRTRPPSWAPARRRANRGWRRGPSRRTGAPGARPPPHAEELRAAPALPRRFVREHVALRPLSIPCVYTISFGTFSHSMEYTKHEME